MRFFDLFRRRKLLLSDLPAEILTKVLHFLDKKQLAQVQLLSQLYEQLIKNDNELQRELHKKIPATYSCKFILLGPYESKKSSLLKDFSAYTKLSNSIGIDFKQMDLNFGSKSLQINVWGTPGQERFFPAAQPGLKNAHGILLVFNLETPITFDALASWHRTSRELAPNTPIVLVGTLINPQNIAVGRLAINTFANEHNLTYVEVNVMDKSQIEKAFKFLGEKVIHQFGDSLPMLKAPKQ
jgi:small GTP-binding protein